MNCVNCGLTLSGMNLLFKDGGLVAQCPRCGFIQPTVPHLVRHESLNVEGGAWSSVLDALTLMAPAIATIGVWELSAAYETIKKVFERLSTQPKSIFNAYSSVETDFVMDYDTIVRLVEFIIPATVSYAVEHKDVKALESAGKLVEALRRFKEARQISDHRMRDVDYFEYSDDPSTYLGGASGEW